VRFYLDHDVDARLCKMLESWGHTAWTANQAGNALAADNDQSVYAATRGAALITQDQELAAQRKRRTIDQTVLLRCEAPDVIEVLELHLANVVHILEHRPHVVIEVTRDRVRDFCAPWPG